MIVTRQDGALRLVAQDDHGTVAGDLAAAWGNDAFAAPAQRESVVLAARRHDVGWRRYDARPLFDADARRPLHFTAIDRAVHVPLYRAGIAEIEDQDVYAGLLVSMHWTGLYSGRWILPGGIAAVAAASDDPLLHALHDIVATEERRWVELIERSWTEGPRSAFEAQRWYAYDLLQAWDVLALSLAMADLGGPAPAVEPASALAMIGELEPAPGPRTLDGVPVGPLGERVQLTLTPVAPGVVEVDPFPFAAPVRTTQRERRIPDRAYADDADLAAAYAAADPEDVAIELRPAAS
jgi:hypothetical protein